jgi:hypothetical protein
MLSADLGWSMQTVGRAAFIAPDSTLEASYYTSMVNSNLEVLEGIKWVGASSYMSPPEPNRRANCHETTGCAA